MRSSLLSLHKALILAEQVTYERINGRVASTSQLLQLVLNDPWFTWLHPLSQLVVRIDELLDDESELSLVEVEHFLIEARSPHPSFGGRRRFRTELLRSPSAGTRRHLRPRRSEETSHQSRRVVDEIALAIQPEKPKGYSRASSSSMTSAQVWTGGRDETDTLRFVAMSCRRP